LWLEIDDRVLEWVNFYYTLKINLCFTEYISLSKMDLFNLVINWGKGGYPLLVFIKSTSQRDGTFGVQIQ